MIYLAAGAVLGFVVVAIVALGALAAAHSQAVRAAAEARAEFLLERRELYSRIQHPDSPQASMIPGQDSGPRPKKWISEDDELKAALARSQALIAEA